MKSWYDMFDALRSTGKAFFLHRKKTSNTLPDSQPGRSPLQRRQCLMVMIRKSIFMWSSCGRWFLWGKQTHYTSRKCFFSSVGPSLQQCGDRNCFLSNPSFTHHCKILLCFNDAEVTNDFVVHSWSCPTVPISSTGDQRTTSVSLEHLTSESRWENISNSINNVVCIRSCRNHIVIISVTVVVNLRPAVPEVQ